MPTPIEISLTTFLDFVFAAGTAKITCVRNAKAQYGQPYEPRKDFWRVLRNAITHLHQHNAPPESLTRILTTLRDPRKQQLYEAGVSAYQRWLGRKQPEWTGATSTVWISDDLIVTVNPELGLELNGQRHLIKLYFKQDQLHKRRIQTALHLLRTIAPPATTVGILDVPRARLFPFVQPAPGIDALLNGEARSFATMWNAL